jgi:glycosyltransferase involved in cell wall biosynthesis
LFLRERLVSAEKSSVVPGSGVNLTRFDVGVAQPWPLEEGRRVVLMAARLLRSKGVAEFAEAASLLRAKDANLRFVLLGGFDFGNAASVGAAELQQWVKRGDIVWINHLDDVRPLLARAEIVVLPSYYREGVPRSLLEACAMGKPVVTTDNTGCREAVEQGVNGLLVPPRDARALAEAIGALLADGEIRRRMGAAGRRRMEERFDERLIVEQAARAYGL